MKRKILLIIGLLTLLFFQSCTNADTKAKPEIVSYNVMVSFPNCEFTTLTKLLTKFTSGMEDGVDINSSALLEIIKFLADNLIDGIPIGGKLNVGKEYLEYFPDKSTKWFIKSDVIKGFRIPVSAIKSVSRTDYGVWEFVDVETEFGKTRFHVSRSWPLPSVGKKIRTSIAQLIGQEL